MVLDALHSLANAARKTEPTWRYGFNLVPTLRFRLRGPPLVGESARVVADLNRDGVAMTSASALLGWESCFDELSAEVTHLQDSLRYEIAAARSAAEDVESEKKTFHLQYLGCTPPLHTPLIYE